eukprot:16200-Heterococcus_DN1.PRE.5
MACVQLQLFSTEASVWVTSIAHGKHCVRLVNHTVAQTTEANLPLTGGSAMNVSSTCQHYISAHSSAANGCANNSRYDAHCIITTSCALLNIGAYNNIDVIAATTTTTSTSSG